MIEYLVVVEDNQTGDKEVYSEMAYGKIMENEILAECAEAQREYEDHTITVYVTFAEYVCKPSLVFAPPEVK
jgi:hypothetical protein